MKYVSISRKRDKYLCFGFILLYLGFITFFCLPEVKLHFEAKNAYQNLQMFLERKELWENYLKLKEENDTKANKLKGLEDRLFALTEDYLLIDYLNQFFLMEGIEILNCQFTEVKYHEPYPGQRIQYNLTGQFGDILNLFYALIQNYFYRDIDYIITSEPGGLKCKLEVEVLFKLDEKERIT